MNRIKRFMLAAILVMALLSALTVFGFTHSESEQENRIQSATLMSSSQETVILAAPSNSNLSHNEYRIIFSSDSFTGDATFAQELNSTLSAMGTTLKYSADTKAEESYEILFGNTSRALSSELYELCVNKTESNELVWGFLFRDGKLAFAANSNEAFTRGTNEFKELFLSEDGILSVTEGFLKISSLPRAIYDEEVRLENERLEAEAEANRLKRIEELKKLIAAFKLADFGDTSMETSMPESPYGSPDAYPTVGEHPRLTVTSYMIPYINEFLGSGAGSYLSKSFWELADSNFTGKLPAAKEVTSGREGFHNVDEVGLMKIEAKALAYLLTGNELYGYEAIYAIKNYLTTLDLQHIYSDQCREFGRTIMCAAEVYDWCYDLLTDADKQQLILGITDICAGTNQKGKQMEVGFPPSGQGSVSGHGSERQILRDYFSVAVAIFDEDPTWFEYVGGRIYNEYVPFRNYYYQSGTYPQGINLYAPGRHNADAWSAWIMFTFSGETAYDDSLANIVKSFYSYELPNGTFFGTGDSSRQSNSKEFRTASYLIAALYCDDYLYSWLYKNTGELENISASNLEMSYSHIAILLSYYLHYTDKSASSPVSRYDDVPTVSYNGYPVGQMISRYEWENTSAPAVFMKIGERTTANHEHGDAGTFQIYYKGLYTGESGIYDSYGSTHHYYYHQATVAHNGILVYNSSKYNGALNEDGNPVSVSGYWYSGSQRRVPETGNLTSWLESSDYDTGTVMGHEYSIKKDGTTDYAYLAGDITAAYASETVDYVGRRMMTIYTANESIPLYFIVYDRIISDSEDYEKRFVLQAPVEPIINEDEKTVTLINGEGKLVLTSLKGADRFDALGGENRGFLINGVQCTPVKSSSTYWGRVEICAALGEKTTDMLNVIYTTDADSDASASSELIETDKLIGTRIENTVVIFAKDLDPTCEQLEFETEGKGLIRYFISGIHTGTWNITVDGLSVATVVSSEDGCIVDFYAPCGDVVITPGNDVPLANGGKIIYNAYGGKVPDDAPLTYVIGEPTVLPTNIVRGSDIFLGWYSDESLTDEYLITEVLASEKGRFNVYAKYKACPITETYEGVSIDHSEASKDINLLSYNGNGKAGSRFETVTDGTNTYLKITKGTADPSFNFDKKVSTYIGTDTAITLILDIAKDGDNPVPVSNCRMRATSTTDTVSIFKTATDGSLSLAGKTTIMTLAESFQRLCITIDFASGTISAYERYGELLATESFSVPSNSSAATTLEWMKTLTYTFNWYMSTNNDGVMLIDNISVYTGYFVPEVEVIPEGMEKIIYNTGGAPLPDDAPKYYKVGEQTPLPTLTSNVDKFLGWYSTSTYDAGTEIDAIPSDTEGEFNVYARWLDVYLTEDFEGLGDISYTEEKGYFGNVLFNASTKKPEATAYTETDKDENGNTYLVVIRGTSDPHLSKDSTFASFTGPNKAFTVQLQLGLVDGLTPVVSTFRIRSKVNGNNSDFSIFSTTTDGKVLLGANSSYVLTTLTTDFQTITVTVNWDTSQLTGYVNGIKTLEMSFDSEKYSIDWLNGMVSCMNFRLTSGEAFKLDNFYAYMDVFSENGVIIPDGKGLITYETNGGTLATGAPIFFDKTAETALPEITKSGDEFLGWYTDPSFSEESKITVIAPTDADSITVYARWRGIFINKTFDNVADSELTEDSGTIGGVAFNYKVGSSLVTKTDEDENKYLIFSISSEEATDPHLSISGSVPGFSGSTQALTVKASLSLVEDTCALACSYRLRARSGTSKLDLHVFSINSTGNVLLGSSDSGVVLCELTSESFTDIAVTVNWDTGMLTGYVNGEEIASVSFDVEARGLDWLATVSNTMYFYSKTTKGAIKIDNILAYTDVYYD